MVDISNFVWRETDLPHRVGKQTSKPNRHALKTEYSIYFAVLLACFLPVSLVAWTWRNVLGKNVKSNPLRSAISQAREISAAICMS